MRLVLHIVGGPAAGARFRLASGQAARVGKTEWADFAVPADALLADVHFAVLANPHGCRVQAVGEAALQINGEEVQDAALHDGDRLTAGGSVFQVQIDGAASAAATTGQSPKEGAGAPGRTGTKEDKSSIEVAAQVELSDAARPLLSVGQTVAEFIAALLQAGLTPDAVRVRAAELSCRDAVRWAADCVRRTLGDSPRPQEVAALDAAEAWAASPTEENRRTAEAAAIALNYEGPAAFAAMGAFWSGDNLAPAGLPPAPTPPGLYVQGVTGAVLMASTKAKPEEVYGLICEFLDNSNGNPST